MCSPGPPDAGGGSPGEGTRSVAVRFRDAVSQDFAARTGAACGISIFYFIFFLYRAIL